MKAKKQTVSITLSTELYANVKRVGINVSKVAEEALNVAYAARRRETLGAEVEQDLAAAENYADKHGSFGDLAQRHYERDDAV